MVSWLFGTRGGRWHRQHPRVSDDISFRGSYLDDHTLSRQSRAACTRQATQTLGKTSRKVVRLSEYSMLRQDSSFGFAVFESLRNKQVWNVGSTSCKEQRQHARTQDRSIVESNVRNYGNYGKQIVLLHICEMQLINHGMLRSGWTHQTRHQKRGPWL